MKAMYRREFLHALTVSYTGIYAFHFLVPNITKAKPKSFSQTDKIKLIVDEHIDSFVRILEKESRKKAIAKNIEKLKKVTLTLHKEHFEKRHGL